MKGGTALVVSARKGAGILSTVEIDTASRDADGKSDVPIVRTMGHSNTPPGKEANRGATALRRHLRALPEAGISACKLSTRRDQERRIMGAAAMMRRKVGYDPVDRSRLETAREGPKDFPPKGLRKRGLDALIESQMPKQTPDRSRRREQDMERQIPCRTGLRHCAERPR